MAVKDCLLLQAERVIKSPESSGGVRL